MADLHANHGELGQYAGAAIRGSSPSIDVHRKHVYIATGNVYSVPEHVSQCQENQNDSTMPTHLDACVEPENHGNSILALDLDSGDIKWYRRLGGYEAWFLACFLNVSTCPTGPNVDADFGEAPMMLSTRVNGTNRDIVVAVQKSGFAWALDRNNGSLLWSTGSRYYKLVLDSNLSLTHVAFKEEELGEQLLTRKWCTPTSVTLMHGKNFTLKPSNNITTGGGWVAMNPHSGKIIWSTANPTGAASPSPVSVANGVLFAGSPNPQGSIYAMDTGSGKFLWSYDTGATVYGGMSISNGCIYVGSGYKVNLGFINPTFTAGTSLFAFSVK